VDLTNEPIGSGMSLAKANKAQINPHTSINTYITIASQKHPFADYIVDVPLQAN